MVCSLLDHKPESIYPKSYKHFENIVSDYINLDLPTGSVEAISKQLNKHAVKHKT